MRAGFFLAFLLCATALPVAAQPDPMAEQRCVWSCLAQSRGANDPRYHACVERMCSGLGAPPRSAPRCSEPTRAAEATWRVKSQSGRPAAGLCAPEGVCLEIACAALGALRLRLDPAHERFPPGHLLLLRVDGQDFHLSAPPPGRDGLLAWEATPPLLAALRNGASQELLTGRGRVPFSLRGSGAAVSTVERRC
ncbi:hypothetical protein [Sabulicella glaciei]|uniref:Uncharacterized protein n=1 Tax=Sabulicella glaciei TaxID=2984948 RepID=A0ABT3NYJ6_9PROT|nr:hypothetical protein [Roseococcus sp. MDT2-1-1]MCW8087200.1 hypothetical protein [Roseococcus sp. MDT2-1-1]